MNTRKTPRYPEAPLQPKTVTFGSVSYEDPYHWLEEESEQSLAFQSQQDALAQEQLRALPHYHAFLESELAQGRVSTRGVVTPTYAGGRWFRAGTPDGEKFNVVEVSDDAVAPGRRLLDFNVGITDNSEPRKVDSITPSPDGRKVIVVWSSSGHECQNLQVLEVDTGEVLLKGIPQISPVWMAWLPDSSGFYYTAYDPALTMRSIRIYLHRLGQPPPTQPEELEETHPMMFPRRSADGRHVFIVADHLNQRPDYLRDAAGDGPWMPFLKGVPHSFRGDIIDDRYIAITTEDASTGRVVSIPLATPTDRSTWRELLPASASVLCTLIVVGNRYVLVDLVDTYSRVRVFGADGALQWEIPLPEPGVVNMFTGSYVLYNMVDCVVRGGADEIVFVFSSLRTSAALYRANLVQRAVERLTEPQTRLDAVVQDCAVTSKDGARVPYRLVARRDLDLTKPQPTIIFGYGGYAAAMVPGWTQFATWIRNGGVLALAHLRGGGEFGPDWWHQGRLKHKQNSYNDVHAIAEDLIRSGATTPQQLGVHGGSNGGTMAAAAAVQRPDLYQATAPQVPHTDMLARVRDPIAMNSSMDFGDPLDPEMSQVLYALSPYQNVRDGVRYPAMYIDCGLNDARCPPWHGRKFAARVQQASSNEAPVLLRVRAGAGHGAVGKQALAEQQAETFAFFADQLGLPLPGRP
jgi:prolyl oligopeptidase